MELQFQRNFMPYVLIYYVPIAMIVMVSWFSFWIRSETPRVFILMTCLLFLTYFANRINEMSVFTDYTKAIDIYTGISVTMVFLAFVGNDFFFYIYIILKCVISQFIFNFTEYLIVSCKLHKIERDGNNVRL